jgi:hypothetical protein
VCAGDASDVFAGAVEIAGDVRLFHSSFECVDDGLGFGFCDAVPFLGELAECGSRLVWGHAAKYATLGGQQILLCQLMWPTLVAYRERGKPQMQTTAPTAKCTRCGRTLRSATSIAAGMGRTCKAKVAAAARQINAAAAYKPAQVTKATELVELAAIVRVRFAVFTAVSSRGDDLYTVNAATRTCSCPAGEKGLACYHLAAAEILTAA